MPILYSVCCCSSKQNHTKMPCYQVKEQTSSKYLSKHMSSPAEDSKYEVERHRTCREGETLMDECLSVSHILNCKMGRRANPF